jgi:hypothetical protein
MFLPPTSRKLKVNDTGDAQPIRQVPYRIPYQYIQWVKDEIAIMEKNGIIRRSTSPWATPAIIVPKRGEGNTFEPRLVYDYRKVNKVTKKDAHPMPRIDDILSQMQGKPRYFSILDLFMGFLQVPLSPQAKERTAFVTPFGQWEFNRMPFGLCNAPTTFQRMMNTILSDLIGKVCFVFVDDISIFTSTFEEHLRVLEEIFQRLRKHSLFAKPKKCTFASHEIKLLGHIVDKKGIHTDPEKIAAIMDFPVPTNRTEVRAFTGLTSYYRNFVQQFAKEAATLNDTLKKSNEPFEFPPEAIMAFNTIKQKLTSAPFLR